MLKLKILVSNVSYKVKLIELKKFFKKIIRKKVRVLPLALEQQA